jgi:hypothetical protein
MWYKINKLGIPGAASNATGAKYEYFSWFEINQSNN